MVLSLLTVVIASFYDTARFNNNNDITLYKLNRYIVLSIMLHTRLFTDTPSYWSVYIVLAESQYCQFRKQERKSPYEYNSVTFLKSQVSSIFHLHSYCLRQEILRSVILLVNVLVCWSVGWLVRSFFNILPTAAMAGYRAPFLVAHASCINRVIANLL